jgi:alanine racemase
MDAPKEDWLSREQIEQVIGSMSAADLVDAMAKYPTEQDSLQMAILAFDTAASRAGVSNGTAASQHVRMSDLKYLGEQIKGAINVDNPLSEGQGA